MYANDDILLVDKELIFKYTQLGGNVDVDKIYPFVKISQDIQVQELLGTKLYRYILDQVEAGTLTGNYQTLVSHYIQPMLIHYAMAAARMTPEALATRMTDGLISGAANKDVTIYVIIIFVTFQFSFQYTK